ncbi:isoprenyl transferase [Spelaeicoccus albus]|uniref:Isoprenyl transferase n=1 Tax=Spelaeicoccus albus TaxID=1280376 RepID=A0A7Z0D352_9MICO|nr:isoprenyl transferase [Spelaeicoccus albus]NYI67997.1 short-chain Z-isoprenyl diphosphate synthase [Spelaeicoccus albus]
MGLRRHLYSAYERGMLRSLLREAPEELPAHVAVIIDGNRRWAKLSGAPARHGHLAGAEKIPDFLRWCEELGIKVVTLYLLSNDNFVKRSPAELSALTEIISDAVDHIAATDVWRVHPVGALDLLPADLHAKLDGLAESTAERTGLHVNVAIGYGGRLEISDAIRSLLRHYAAEGLTLADAADQVTPDQIAEHLYTKGQPDPDLIIRTSGEQRLSGFLLWQSAHSEFYFCEAYWPAFRRVDFFRAVRSYVARERRYGA